MDATLTPLLFRLYTIFITVAALAVFLATLLRLFLRTQTWRVGAALSAYFRGAPAAATYPNGPLPAQRRASKTCRLQPDSDAERDLNAAPPCPKCGEPMVQKLAKKERKQTSTYWGCHGFPTCRGTRDILSH